MTTKSGVSPKLTESGRLLVHCANGQANSHTLSTTTANTIGRGLDNTILLQDPGCSRRHCRIEYQDGRWMLHDVGSRNGTLVNGQQITQHTLSDGDVISIADCWMVFSIHKETVPEKTNVSEDTQDSLPIRTHLEHLRQSEPLRPRRYSDTQHKKAVESDGDTAKFSEEPLTGHVYVSSKTQQAQQDSQFGRLIGNSKEIQAVLEQVAKSAPTNATILLRGESGVGKELIAQAIHAQSRRSRGPYICVNCAALTETLLESELFGHERGAFTGATERKKGKFEQAHQGTILLDEIGEMAPAVQAKFLRVLEGHAFERVGGQSPVRVDTRIIASTNKNLEEAVRKGTFRKDLFFRLHVLEIFIPPLRKRTVDIPLLAEFFVMELAQQWGSRLPRILPEAMERLLTYDWPGNVRELKNTIERAVVACQGRDITPADLVFAELDESVRESDSFQEISLETVELKHIVKTLQSTRWNKSRAAQILGIERSTLDRKLKRYGIKKPSDLL